MFWSTNPQGNLHASTLYDYLNLNDQAHSRMGLQPTGPIETTMCDYETIESVNSELYHNLRELVKTPFFKYFQVRRLS
jgi:hypothetical protein